MLRNYKSIGACDVSLGPLTVFVGPNGSGKSNFVDALRFVSDSLNVTLGHALRERGGVQNVRKRSRGHPTHFGIRLDLDLADARTATYAFTVGAEADGGFVVAREECHISPSRPLGPPVELVVEAGEVKSASCEVHSVLERDRLSLVTVSALPEFRPLYDALCATAFYNINPERIRELQDPDPGQVLLRDGRNIASVLREISRRKGCDVVQRINERLAAIGSGVVEVRPCSFGPKETLEFLEEGGDDDAPWRFYAASMSDGTLRALGVLVAVHQGYGIATPPVRVIGVEEPEMAIHPGATRVLADSLVSMTKHVQVVLTSHSPSLLANPSIATDQIRAVCVDRGQTYIGPVSGATRTLLEQRLYSAGELLERGQLEPEPPAPSDQLGLFDTSST